jgi:hypothetical protein
MIEALGVEFVKLVTKLEMDIAILVQPVGMVLISGATRDHSTSFIQIRQKVVDRTYLEVNRLEKRLTKVITYPFVLIYSCSH